MRAVVSFPDSKKEVVSGIDMMNVVTVMLFEKYGEDIRLAGIEKARWPFPLPKEEDAYLTIQHRKTTKHQGFTLKSFFATMVGTQSRRNVFYASFSIVLIDKPVA